MTNIWGRKAVQSTAVTALCCRQFSLLGRKMLCRPCLIKCIVGTLQISRCVVLTAKLASPYSGIRKELELSSGTPKIISRGRISLPVPQPELAGMRIGQHRQLLSTRLRQKLPSVSHQ